MFRDRRRLARRLRIAAAGVSLGIAAAGFSGLCGAAAKLLGLQLVPALATLFAAFSAGAFFSVAGVAAATFLFGRFYCSVICPFGILQEVLGAVLPKCGKSAPPNLPLLRYTVAGTVYGALAAGWCGGLLLLDPYSNFGRILVPFSAGGAISLAVIVALVIWKRRIFCTAVCPAGTLLGVAAARGIFRLTVSDRCLRCGKCLRGCPAGCIDLATKTIDNERCLRCLKCMAECPVGCIGFSAVRKKSVPEDASRRAFLLRCAALAAGALAGGSFLPGLMKRSAAKLRILPPGAGDAERFAARCTACQLCVANCPEKIIVPAPGGAGPVSLDPENGKCRFDCNRCSQLCPTGALIPLSLARKQHTRIGVARIDLARCVVVRNGEPCGECARACPVDAIGLQKEGIPKPIDGTRCIGCGACRAACPAFPDKAIEVMPVEKQEQTGNDGE